MLEFLARFVCRNQRIGNLTISMSPASSSAFLRSYLFLFATCLGSLALGQLSAVAENQLVEIIDYPLSVGK